MSLLARRLLAVHDALTAAQLPHAFGGAIALAYCTEEPRGTRDIDVNVFVDPHRAKEVFAALPPPVSVTAADIEAAEREGQTRVWWEDTPIDIPEALAWLERMAGHEHPAARRMASLGCPPR